jgi:glutamine synthetase
MYSNSPKAKRVEFRCPDPTANPYLAFLSVNAWQGWTEYRTGLNRVIRLIKIFMICLLKNSPVSPKLRVHWKVRLNALADDHEFLLKGDVFTEDVIQTWIDYKMENEVKPMALQPHPYEFSLYYDV